jgi:hypothetical protein
VGFSATKSGIEKRILKHTFTPEEAQIATCLSYKWEPLEMLLERVGNLVESSDTTKSPTGANNAISLLKKKKEVEPPQTREDLYEIIIANKKSKLGKFKLNMKFLSTLSD